MKKLDVVAYQEIRDWMYRNARPLELAIWQNLFEEGSKGAVLAALSFYQNADGGFGHALEADNWNPESSPYTTLCAINILKTIDFHDISHPMIQGILDYLESGEHRYEYGWLFNIPSNNNYARAPWWSYDDKANETESIGVTAGLVSYILSHKNYSTSLYNLALQLSDNIIGYLETKKKYGDMGIEGYSILLDTIKMVGLENRFDYDYLRQRIGQLISTSIEKDVSKWSYYGVRPSNYITSPNHMFYKENEEIVLKEIDYLIETRESGCVWGITWSWFEHNERYAKEFAISENWWKASKAIEKINFLRNFGRLN